MSYENKVAEKEKFIKNIVELAQSPRMQFTVIMIVEDEKDKEYHDDFDSLKIEDLCPEVAANLLLSYDEEKKYL